MLHVDAAAGQNHLDLSSAEQPYKTITHALEMAPNTSTVILLAPGHYSHSSGEEFPLRLRPGITIQGNAGETRNTLIVGSGDFDNGDVTENTAIVTAHRSGLANITVSNPKGNGVWVIAGEPVLRRIALVANAVAGVQVSQGAPVIENSYFNRNQIGLSIGGNSRATVRSNYFEATGRAITIASPAIPTINNNRIDRNDVGIALKNNARPVLEANVLNNNGRNGIIEVDADTASTAVTRPDVSSDIAISQPVAALAPAPVPEANPIELERPRETPSIAVAQPEPEEVTVDEPTREELPVIAARLQSPAPEPVPEISEVIDNDDATAANVNLDSRTVSSFRQHLASSAAPESLTNDERPPILQRQQTALPTPESTEASTDAVSIVVIPADEPQEAASMSETRREGVSKLLARLNQPSSAEPATIPVSAAVSTSVVSAPVSGQRLPVPSATIPGSDSSARLTPPGSLSLARTFRYRVLVDMTDADDLQVLVPDAFRTQIDNRMVMQAGAYVDEAEAQARVEWLQDHGIEARMNLRE